MTESATTGIEICKRVGRVHLICASVCLVTSVIELIVGSSASFFLFLYFLATGLSLYKGILRAARITAFLSAAWTAISIGVLLTLLWQFPLAFIVAIFKFHTAQAVLVVAALLGMLAFSLWSFMTLGHPDIRGSLENEMIVSNTFFRKPYLGFVAGGLLVLLVGVWAKNIVSDDVRQRAQIEASKQLGNGYRYQVIQVHIWGSQPNRVSAGVIAYDDDEMKTVEVSWGD